MLTQADRNAVFAVLPMVEGYLSTALEDLQHQENEEACEGEREERDVGTIWTCPDATFLRAKQECERFAIMAGPTIARIEHLSHAIKEGLGSDLYLERAGHGAGFADRDYYSDDRDENRAIGSTLSDVVDQCWSGKSVELYVGDDGAAWIVGAEQVA